MIFSAQTDKTLPLLKNSMETEIFDLFDLMAL
jgi:hypothetical protein